MTAYTLQDLEAAKSKLEQLNEKWDCDGGKDPNKYRPAIHAALHDVEVIERALKERGELPWSAQELLENELDHIYPDARSKEVVEHYGKRYERRWVPVKRDQGGLVSRWKGFWVELETAAGPQP
jgi:hypothetical protein